MTHLFNSRRRCVPSLGSQARLGQKHTGDLQKECYTNLLMIRPARPSLAEVPLADHSLLVFGTLVVIMNLLVDLLYAWVDPRISQS